MFKKILPVILLINFICGAQIQKKVFDFTYKGNVLNGVLNMPEDNHLKGIVIIVHGAGPTNAVAQELHYDIRAQLVNSGYGVYMWDKMGCGKSEGTFDYNQSVQTSAKEVITAIETLKNKKIQGSDKIGLWGISRAGWISPLVINQYKGIKFWISVSGVDDKENFNYLLNENLQINGYAKDSIDLLVDELKKGTRITHTGGIYEEYLKATPHLNKNKFIRRFNNNSEITEEGYYLFQKKFMKEKIDKASGLQVYIENFEELLSNIHCPVLALFGERDKHVDWVKTKRLYENTLGKNTDLTIKSFPEGNHNLFKCKTGGFYEFQDNNLSYERCDGFLQTMTDWLTSIE